jgi:hypothetical protein
VEDRIPVRTRQGGPTTGSQASLLQVHQPIHGHLGRCLSGLPIHRRSVHADSRQSHSPIALPQPTQELEDALQLHDEHDADYAGGEKGFRMGIEYFAKEAGATEEEDLGFELWFCKTSPRREMMQIAGFGRRP